MNYNYLAHYVNILNDDISKIYQLSEELIDILIKYLENEILKKEKALEDAKNGYIVS